MSTNELLKNLTGVGSSKLNYYTALKDKTKELEERNTELEILNEIAKNINIDTSMENTLKTVAFHLDKVMHVESINLYLANSQEKICVQKSSVGSDKKVFIVTDACTLTKPSIRPYSQLATKETVYPLCAKDRILGYLSIKLKDINNMSAKKGEFLYNLTEHLSMGLENSLLYKEILFLNLRWEDTFKAITDNIYVIDRNYNLLQFNTAVKKYYGVKRPNKSMADRKCYSVLHGQNQPCNGCPVEQVFSNKEPTQTRKKQDEDYFDVNAYPTFDSQYGISGGVLYERNVTEKLFMESQLIQAAKFKTTGEMAAGVAHELNNPLTTILGNAQLLLLEFGQNGKSKEHRVLAKKILESGKRCKKIIKNLLTFAKEKESNWKQVCLNTCVEDVLDMTAYQLKIMGVNLNLNLKRDLSLANGNKQQIEQVILNFLFNAKDALETVSNPALTVTTGHYQDYQKSWIYLSVSDNGCGVSEKDMDNIFQPFYTTKEETKGYGLGLFVSLGIIENHGGKITLESEKNRGSTFSIYLPETENRADIE